MSAADSIQEIFGGDTVLRAKELESRGLTRTAMGEAVADGRLERIGRGLYAIPGAAVGIHHSLAVVARRVPHAVVCLLSALRFHELTTQAPHEVWIAIGPKDRKPVAGHPPLRVVRYGASHADLGREEHEIEGVRVRVYSVARTVVDLFRYRNKVGIEVAMEALREGWRERRFEMAELNRIAEACRMGRVMKPYLEAMMA